jgi:hypothetical protein
MAVIAAFAFGGLLAGLFQYSALRRHGSQFQAADTALQVRAALISSAPGKASIALLWLAAFALVVLLVFGGSHATIQTIVGSYAAFALVREVTALPGLFALNRRSNHV